MVGFTSGNPNVNGLIPQQAVKALLSARDLDAGGSGHGNCKVNGLTSQQAVKALLSALVTQMLGEGQTAATEWASFSKQLMKQAARGTALLLALHVKRGAVEQMERKRPP